MARSTGCRYDVACRCHLGNGQERWGLHPVATDYVIVVTCLAATSPTWEPRFDLKFFALFHPSPGTSHLHRLQQVSVTSRESNRVPRRGSFLGSRYRCDVSVGAWSLVVRRLAGLECTCFAPSSSSRWQARCAPTPTTVAPNGNASCLPICARPSGACRCRWSVACRCRLVGAHPTELATDERCREG